MRASRKDRQEANETRGEQELTAALELAKTQAEIAKKLNESQVKLARTSTEKADSEFIGRYAEEEELLVQGLELMKNEHCVLIFLSLIKVPAIQKQWLVAECNKSGN